ncbi:MAG: tetratricopeptide repeat protein [Gemmatimonadaceae bacterium]
MMSPALDPAAELQAAVAQYHQNGDVAVLFARLGGLARDADPDALMAAVEPFRDMPEVVIPTYERVVAAKPEHARALVILANAYWLTGRGPEVVGDLASRAMAADPDNRGAWHLWALAEPDPRDRTARWRQVTERFPQDQLARAALADNAASLAGAEHDPLALDLAVRTYEGLLAETRDPAHRIALEGALNTLRGWTL